MIFGKNKSLACFKPNSAAKYRVFCFPSSGGGATLYRAWADWFPDCELWAANYPGRESLHSEPFAETIDQVLAPILAQQDLFEERPFIVYGHSFGALVGFELVNRLQEQGCLANGLCVSARRAPHLPPHKALVDLPEAEFLKELDEMGGIPQALRQNLDMMNFYLPIIRADLRLNDEFQSDSNKRVQCPIYLFSGSQDRITTAEELTAWATSTEDRFEHVELQGGHFFIQEKAAEFSAQLRSVFATLETDDDNFIAF